MRGDRRELLLQRLQQLAHVELGDLGVHATGVEARDIQQLFEQCTRGGQRIVDALGEPAQIAVRLARLRSAALNSRAAPSGCSRSWLAATTKRVFDWLASSALRNRGRELARAFLDAQLQRFVDFAQTLFGALVAGDIAE